VELTSGSVHILRLSIWNRSCQQRLPVLLIVFICSSFLTFAQTPALPAITVVGTVRNSAGEPIIDVSVLLQEQGQDSPIRAKTNTDGTFVLSVQRGGSYTLKAHKTGWRDAVKGNLSLSTGKTEVNLVLEKIADSTPSGMEFSDQPTFTVAGVTDSSQAGGHGSDAGLRTSEALARQTIALKADKGEVTDRLLADDIAGRKLNGSENDLLATLARSPNEFDTNRHLGEFYFLSRKYREAIPLFEAAHRIKPHDYSNGYDLALSYRAIGDYAKAREQATKMLVKTDKAELHALLGSLDERLGDPLNAVHEYEQAARMDPTEQNYFEWGTELLLHRAVTPATQVLTKGSSLYPTSVRMSAGLGAALYAGGLYEQAAARLCAASDLQPADSDPYLFLGKMEEASPAPLPCVEQKMARFSETQPANAWAHYYYAMALLKRAKESGDSSITPVESLLKKAVLIDPKLSQAYMQLGNLYSGRNDYAQAIGNYQKAIEVNPQLTEAHYRLGVAYQRVGDQVKARQEFQAHQQAEKNEAATVERQRREVQQFLIVLKDQPATPQK
jgi:tetratricopeptide (TPR) repeat protein